MKEAVNKRKITAIVAAVVVILAIAGAMAYFSYANGGDGNEHVKAEIVETGIIPDGGADNGTLKRDILPGTSEQKDLKVRLDADTDAFVFLIVKDTVNTNDAGLVTYAIDPGWNVLDKTDLGTMTIQKYKDFFTDKAPGTLELAPQDENTKIYYRVEHGTALSHSFTYPVLKDNQISYSSALTNDDVKNIQDDNAISFQTYAIQMEPFCDPSATGDALIQGAKYAWNQNPPIISVTGVTVAPKTLSMIVGDADQQLAATVEPDNATNKNVTWTSSNSAVASVDSDGKVHAVAAGTATITATTEDGDFTDTCVVTVTGKGHIKWQVQLHGVENGTATFWPAMTNSYGKHEHTGACICDHTWEEIASGNYDFSNCTCTKTVTIDETKNTSIFTQNLTTDQTSGMLYRTLQSGARMWDKDGINDPDTASYKDTLAAMQAAWDITGVTVSDFDLLSRTDAETVKLTNRIVYNESGNAYYWWLATPYGDYEALDVDSRGFILHDFYVDYGGNIGIAPGFSISPRS